MPASTDFSSTVKDVVQPLSALSSVASLFEKQNRTTDVTWFSS
jgi:hypothetical protein